MEIFFLRRKVLEIRKEKMTHHKAQGQQLEVCALPQKMAEYRVFNMNEKKLVALIGGRHK